MTKIAMDGYREDILACLCGLIAQKSVRGEPAPGAPYGRDIAAALDHILQKAAELGFATENYGGHMGAAVLGSGSETFAVLCHIDVVPAGDGWASDPFTAQIRDGRVYGRGAVDNKGAAAAALYALKAVADSGIPLTKTVKVIFGCDEETGWGDIAYYKEHCPDLDYVIAPDASFPIINREKGTYHFEAYCPYSPSTEGVAIKELSAGTRPNIVPAEARAVLAAPASIIARAAANFGEGLPVRFETNGCDGAVCVLAHGKAAHGASPEKGHNALAYLIAFLNTLPLAAGAAESFVYALSELIGTTYDGSLMGIAARDELLGPLSLNMGAITMENGEICAKLDIRYPLCVDSAQMKAKVAARFAEKGISVRTMHAMEPHFVEENSPFIDALKRVYEETFGKKGTCIPCAGATYARAFKNSVAFGPVPRERESMEHSPNEYMEISDIMDLARAIAGAIVEIAG